VEEEGGRNTELSRKFIKVNFSVFIEWSACITWTEKSVLWELLSAKEGRGCFFPSIYWSFTSELGCAKGFRSMQLESILFFRGCAWSRKCKLVAVWIILRLKEFKD